MARHGPEVHELESTARELRGLKAEAVVDDVNCRVREGNHHVVARHANAHDADGSNGGRVQ